MNILINIRYFKSPISRLGVQSILEVIFSFKCNYVIFSTQYQEAPSLTALPVPCSFCFAGFSLGSTVQSHTKGIWMWCVPHPKKAGQTLVLLDTEGLEDVEKVKNKNKNLSDATCNLSIVHLAVHTPLLHLCF